MCTGYQPVCIPTGNLVFNFHFFAFLNPMTWMVSPGIAIDSLLASGESAVGSKVTKDSVYTAIDLDRAMQRYFELHAVAHQFD